MLVANPVLDALVLNLIDYAGLFPPASLSMREAVAEFARARRSPESRALGRFVVPAARLPELAEAAVGVWEGAGFERPAGLSLLLEAGAELPPLGGQAFRVESLELKALEARPEGLAGLEGLEIYVEARPDQPLELWLRELGRAGVRAKLRTGGVKPELIPTPADVARFLARCAEARLAFKATAGLHHPLRGEYPLTYAPDSPRATMHGFLNVFLASALAWLGRLDEAGVRSLLEEREAAAFRLEGDRLAWREITLTAEELRGARAHFSISYGSCSFREPTEELGRWIPQGSGAKESF